MDETLAENLAEVDTLLTLLHLKSRAIRRQDLNEPRSQILLRLLYAAENKMPQVELADTLQLSVPQIQKLTEDLQKLDLVSREEGAPRGGFFISLLREGKAEAQLLLKRRAENEFSLFDQLLAQQPSNGQLIADILKQLKMELAKRAA